MTLPCGVMVAQQILILLVGVRVPARQPQQSPYLTQSLGVLVRGLLFCYNLTVEK